MNCRDFMIQELSYRITNDIDRMTYPGSAKGITFGSNLMKSILILIPVINTIYGIVMITLEEIRRKELIRAGYIPTDANRALHLLTYSIRILSLGVVLLPFMIIGTIMKKIQIRQQDLNHLPSLSSRRMVEVPPDYLL